MKINRFITATAVASIAIVGLAGCAQASTSSDSTSKQLTVFLSADTNIQDLWQKTLIPAFEKDNPGYTVKIDFDLHGLHDQQTVAKLTAATVQKKDPGYDLIDAGFVSQIAASGLLTPVSKSNLAAIADVPADEAAAGGKGGIPYRASSVLLAYDTKTVVTPPKTLDALLAWIKANPGKFTYNSPDSGGSGQSFVTTVLDKTISDADRAKMATDYVPELEKSWTSGFATLAALKPYIYQNGVYPNGNSQVLDLLSSGQISMAPVWSDMFISGQKTGQIPANIGYTQITGPSLTGGAAYLGIPSASPRQAGALIIANWLLSPTAQALVSDGIAGYPVIALDKLPSALRDKLKNADIGHLRAPYFASMNADLNQQWAQKVPGK